MKEVGDIRGVVAECTLVSTGPQAVPSSSIQSSSSPPSQPTTSLLHPDLHLHHPAFNQPLTLPS